MLRLLIFIVILPLFLACKQQAGTRSIQVQFDNIAADSIGFRMIQYMDGTELLDTLMPVGKPIEIKDLKEDMYLAVFYWPRTYIPHSVMRNKFFNREEGDDYQLTKPFYVDTENLQAYQFGFTEKLNPEDIELNMIRELNLKTDKCEECALSEVYWENYNAFFRRKDSLARKFNSEYYNAIQQNDKNLRQKYLKADSIKQRVWIDQVYLQDLNQLIKDNADKKVSTFFLFYQLYLFRDFPKFRHSFESLKGDALKSRYYPMLKKQFDRTENAKT